MKVIMKKNGFTLVEIILVVAILLLLFATVALNVSEILGRSDAAAEDISGGVDTMEQEFENSEQQLQAAGFH